MKRLLARVGFVFALGVGGFGGVACGPPAPAWPAAQPQTVQLDRPAAAMFEGALKTFRMSGYNVLSSDADRLYIQVQSLVDGDALAQQDWGGIRVVLRVSQLNFQFERDSLIVTVTGYHVSSGKMDPRVADEIRQLLTAMRNNAPQSAPTVNRPAASASATASASEHSSDH